MFVYRKFCAKYGAPQIVRSDTAKTFQRAAKQIAVDWRFNPPKAPWWGGFYERFVQLLKRPLRKVLKTALVTKKELEAVIAEIETSAVLQVISIQMKLSLNLLKII
jgi:hypothetical protein